MNVQLPVIGTIHSCFKEKFGIPRQPGLAPLAKARLELAAPYNDLNALDGLEGCSHIWIQFVFHANKREEWKPKIKPPRLGGNKSMGVFATRSPVRPAPIGLSVVKLDGFYKDDEKVWLELSGVDLLDGTPVLDIKPYVPYVDSVKDAVNDFAPLPPPIIAVTFDPSAIAFCSNYHKQTVTDLAELITQILQQDPRPQYQSPEPERLYGMMLLDLNIRWRYEMTQPYRIQVFEITYHNKT
ncbi:MAG: tRNA (N6-threonylcarbamoyladenosine(37)-N6)-methyltransferase TrmO [Moraxellaceae bacterium]|nr:MAG: tRNA (N6-threonylcarbamoyladenosine(37)-N6)-methyltransferase TrmO [Moraxellaceae bacterium]